jgi:hypothetical protein
MDKWKIKIKIKRQSQEVDKYVEYVRHGCVHEILFQQQCVVARVLSIQIKFNLGPWAHVLILVGGFVPGAGANSELEVGTQGGVGIAAGIARI